LVERTIAVIHAGIKSTGLLQDLDEDERRNRTFAAVTPLDPMKPRGGVERMLPIYWLGWARGVAPEHLDPTKVSSERYGGHCIR
jgi:hypothetical protein